jgi:hypothetical protein
MPEQIDDEMLQTFAVVADPGALAGVLRDRYDGLVDRVTLYLPFRPGERDSFWKDLAISLAG